MFENIDKARTPKVPESVRNAERILMSEAPDLYAKISRFRNCRCSTLYERAKAQLSISKYDFEKYHKTLADFCNV